MNFTAKLAFGFKRQLPIILQTEEAECGLASLAMVTSHYGHQLDLNSIRRRFSASLKGMTLYDIGELAERLSLSTRAIRVDVSDLAELKLPCILHWEFGHFVVLAQVTHKGAVIHDPARGRRHVTRAELSSSFTGIALEVWPDASFKKKNEQQRFQLTTLFKHVVGLKRALGQILLIALCLEVFAILSPLGLQLIIDQAIVSADMDLVTIVVLGLGLLLILQTVLGFVRSWATMVLMTRLNIQWETGLFAHLIGLPLSYFEKRHVGDIVSRFGALGSIQKTLTTDLVGSVLDGLMVVGMLAMMLLYSLPLAAISLVVTALYALVRAVFYHPYRNASEAELVYHAKENSHFMESIRGAASVKSLGLEERRQATWLNTLIDAINANLKTAKLDIVFTVVSGLLFGIGRLLMLWIGGRAVIQGHLTIGMLMAFSSYQEQFTGRVISLIGMVFQLKMLTLQGERLADIALAEPEPKCHKSIAWTSPSDKLFRLEAKTLRFRYGDAEPDIFSNLNIMVEPGESVAIIGPSGCGKTTLIKTLAGLMTPTEGVISLDGQNVREIGLANYRKITGRVLQDDRLFAGTFADNIAGFDPKADPDWIEECARMASIDAEIKDMPMGYESLVGDMGSSLSGGQKQRIFLARALYRRPRLRFLDEATSHLDVDNELKINDALASLNVSLILVAHRPTTIAMADRIIHLDNGR